MSKTLNFKYDVFLSYSSRDKSVVREIAKKLHKDGIHVWFDEWEIKPGDSIPAKIEEGLEHSRILILCMSENAFGSDWSQLESNTFRFRDPLNKERRFIPLRLDNAPIKGSLAQFHYISWLKSDSEKEYLKLLEACSKNTLVVEHYGVEDTQQHQDGPFLSAEIKLLFLDNKYHDDDYKLQCKLQIALWNKGDAIAREIKVRYSIPCWLIENTYGMSKKSSVENIDGIDYYQLDIKVEDILHPYDDKPFNITTSTELKRMIVLIPIKDEGWYKQIEEYAEKSESTNITYEPALDDENLQKSKILITLFADGMLPLKQNFSVVEILK